MTSSIFGEPSCEVHQKDKLGAVRRHRGPGHGLLQQPSDFEGKNYFEGKPIC